MKTFPAVASWTPCGFGVVDAVNEFVRRSGYRLVAITNELFPTYVIAKDVESVRFQQLERTIVKHMSFIKVGNVRDRQLSQELCVDEAG
jgi:hypothetical protein